LRPACVGWFGRKLADLPRCVISLVVPVDHEKENPLAARDSLMAEMR
jgi:hypothetical protein